MREKTNCPNCGAPISGIICEYCGTQFFDLADIELYKYGFLRMKIGNSIMLCEAMPVNMAIEHKYNQATEITVGFVLKRVCDDAYFIEKEKEK